MRLRYHLEEQKSGIMILEANPQIRSLFVYSQIKSRMRVPLPHIYFTVRYRKFNGSIIYPGVYGCGLFVFCSLKSIKSFDDLVHYLPTDTGSYKGLVCTNHAYDNKIFKSVEDLVNCVITLWWSATHVMSYIPFKDNNTWINKSLDDLKNGDWKEQVVFKKAINSIPRINLSFSNFFELPDNAVLVDEEYPVKSKLILDF